MSQSFETDATFICPECGELAETKIAVPEPNWGAAEKMSDLTSEDQTEADCPKCGTTFDAYVYNSASSCDVTLTEYPDTVVHADMAFFSHDPAEDMWEDYDVPEDPHSIFVTSQRQLEELLERQGSDAGDAMLNRMVFAQHVSAMEAFLADTLINHVMASEKPLSALLKGNSDLNAEKFTLSEIVGQPDLVKSKVRDYLRSLLYHNLPKIDAVYRHALGVEVLPKGQDHSELMKAIHLRHDCVHRNGYDTAGNRLTVFTKDYIRGTAAKIRSLVDRVELATSPF